MTEERYLYLTDPDRLSELRASDLLDTPADEEFDRLTRLASTVLHAPVALVSLVDADRQYLKSCIGLPEPWASARETPLSHSFCQHVVVSNDVLIIEDARNHPLVRNNLAIRDLNVVAYAGIPLVTSAGHVLGSFCVIDDKPRVWTAEEIRVLQDLAGSVMTEIELRMVAREAERRRREWQALLDFSIEGVIGIDLEGRCTYINQAAVQLLGYTAQECLGQNMHTLVHYKRPDGSPYPIEECPIYQAAFGGIGVRLVEVVLWRKDGSPLTALYSCSPIRQDETLVGSVATIVDVSERKQAEEALQLRATQLRKLSEAALAMNSAASLDSLLQSLTDKAREIIGAHCAFVTVLDQEWGQDASAASVSQGRTKEQDRGASSEHLGDSPSESVRCDEESKDSADLRYQIAVPLVGRDGRDLGRLQLSHKYKGGFTPEDKAILIQLAQMASVAIENTRLLEQTQEAVRVRNEFLTSVSHDLKNPLVAIKGTAQLLRRRIHRTGYPGAADLTQGLDRINTAGTRMTAQIDELLDLTRLQTGEPLDLNIQLTNLVALARRVVDEHQTSSEAHNVCLQTDLERLDCRADPLRTERVLTNLIANAIKYSPQGGDVRVQVSRHSETNVEWARIDVHDEGIGIPEADLPHIFERYHRAGNVAGRFSGTGIGLSSSRQIIEQHGGSITVESREGSGSTFIILLPL